MTVRSENGGGEEASRREVAEAEEWERRRIDRHVSQRLRRLIKAWRDLAEGDHD